ncbi:hypothetical protein B484DRAFT_468349 [Ochromonadaceae sp. CCMP2298]|nr:hypothetical protein B484DRAFT_468349 [Ochromonadaceae sp. CCMP2298]
MVKYGLNTSRSVTGNGPTTNKPKQIKKVRKPKKPKFNLHREIHKVLKHIHPQTSISKNSMGILNDFMGDIFDFIPIQPLLQHDNGFCHKKSLLHEGDNSGNNNDQTADSVGDNDKA